MKQIALALLALVLLIIVCTLSKVDDIVMPKSAYHVSSVSTAQHTTVPVEFDIYQRSDRRYEMQGRFGSLKQADRLTKAFSAQQSTLSSKHALIDRNYQSDENVAVLVLIEEIAPIFIEHYDKGHIAYRNGKLTIYGEVDDNNAKRAMQMHLQNAPIDTVDLSSLKPKEPMHFVITKEALSITFEGTTPHNGVYRTIESASAVPIKKHNLHIDKSRIDDGIEKFVSDLMPCFSDRFTKGKIRYKEGQLYIDGYAKDEAGIAQMQTLLSKSPVKTHAKLSIDPQILAQRKAEEEARRKAEEARRKAEEERKKAEEEARRKAEEEARKKAEEEARRKAEEEAKRKAQEARAKAEIVKLLQVENIEFETASSSLTPKGKETVSKLTEILRRYPDIRVEIAGHTDSDGDDALNLKLSQERVDEVKRALVASGIESSRIVAKGYGETRPIAPNDTPQNKQRNRRVEIIIIGGN